MLLGIREMFISTREHLPFYQRLLGDGSTGPLSLITSFKKRDRLPMHSSRAQIRGQRSRRAHPWQFCGHGLSAGHHRCSTAARKDGVTVFAYYVGEPIRYGILKFDENEPVIDLASYCPIGRSPDLFLRQCGAPDCRQPAPLGPRITGVSRRYLELNKLHVVKLGRGTPGSIPAPTTRCSRRRNSSARSSAGRGWLLVGCPEEIACGANRNHTAPKLTR